MPLTSSLRREMASKFPSGEVKLVGAKLRPAQHVVEHLEYVVKIGLQAGKRNGCRIGSAVGLDFGGADFEIVIQLIAGLRLGAAGAPDFPVHVDHARLVGRLGAGATANPGHAIDQRQFVILLQENDHAVGQHDAFGLLGMKSGQRGNVDLLPVGGLCGRRSGLKDQPGQEREGEKGRGNVSSLPTSVLAGRLGRRDGLDNSYGAVGGDESLIGDAPDIRLGDFVEFSTWWNSSRQSP